MGSIKTEIDQVVRPQKPIKQATYALSTVDQYVPKKWVTRCMYFSLPPNADFENVYASLKDGLKAVISRYPALTGRVCHDPEKQHYVAIQTDDDPKVVFHFKDHTKETSARLNGMRAPSYAQLKEAGYPMQGVMEAWAPNLIFEEVSYDSALFSAQANFVEGGLVLTIVFNHLIIDGGSFNEVLKLWADFTTTGCPSDVEILPYDEDIVQRLRIGKTDGRSLDPRLWIEVPATKSGLRVPPQGTPATGIVHPKRKDAQVTRTDGSEIMLWTISPDKQKKLKEFASAYSTMNAIFAMLWSRNVYYSAYSAKGLSTAHARMPVDMRGRLNPPIPETYLGNTVNLLAVETSSEEVDNTQATVQKFAQLLRAGINSVAPEDIEVFIATANSLPADKGLAPPFPGVFPPCTLLNDHSRMGVHTFNWGGVLGQMDRLRDPLDDVPVRNISAVQCYPRLADGTLEVCTLFDQEVMQKLQSDKEFLEFFQPFGKVQLEL